MDNWSILWHRLHHVKNIIKDILDKHKLVLKDEEIFIALHALADSSVNIIVRVWVKSDDYWNLYFDINEMVYKRFNNDEYRSHSRS